MWIDGTCGANYSYGLWMTVLYRRVLPCSAVGSLWGPQPLGAQVRGVQPHLLRPPCAPHAGSAIRVATGVVRPVQ